MGVPRLQRPDRRRRRGLLGHGSTTTTRCRSTSAAACRPAPTTSACSRHRIGVGLEGSGVPPWSFAKPMKKHRFVTGIVQPFATAGGADREPVSAMRVNAPSRAGRQRPRRVAAPISSGCAAATPASGRRKAAAGHRPAAGQRRRRDHRAGRRRRGDRDAGAGPDRLRPRPRPARHRDDDRRLSWRCRSRIVANDLRRHRRATRRPTCMRGVAGDAASTTFALERRGLGQPLYVAEILAALRDGGGRLDRP